MDGFSDFKRHDDHRDSFGHGGGGLYDDDTIKKLMVYKISSIFHL